MTVSVVIPTYNRAHQIADTVRSVLAQSAAPAEIVVVDDGSTDDTEAVCRSFGSDIRYVRQANAGVSAARNHGASLSRGALLAFVDSDDLWHPDKLAVQQEALDLVPTADWSVTGCDVIGLDGSVIPGREGFEAVFGVFREAGLDATSFFRRHLTESNVTRGGREFRVFHGDAWPPLFLGNFCLPSSALVRRSVFERIGGFDADFRLAEETEFFHRLAAASDVVLVDAALVGYRVGQAGSLISPANTRRLIENALRSGEQAARLRSHTERSAALARAGRVSLLRKLAYTHLSLRDGRESRRVLREAWRTGGPRDAWSLGILAASLLPAGVLEGLHRLKRAGRAQR